MKQFNRKLSQLEAIYQIAEPVLKPQTPKHIITSIKTALENSQLNLDYEWFLSYANNNPTKATNFAQSILQENNQLISKKSILESITINMRESNV